MASRRVGELGVEAMDGVDSQGADGLPLWLRGRNAVFQVLYDMAQDVNFSQVLLLLLWVFDLLFLLVIPLGPSHVLPWAGASTAHGLWGVLGKVWFIPGAAEHLDGGYAAPAMYAAFAGGTALILGLAVWQVTAKMGWTDNAPRYITHALRLGARVAIQGLWMPIMINLASAFVCEGKGNWYTSSLSCWSGPHLGMVVSSAILIPSALLWFGTCALTYLDRVPDYTGKKNIMAAAHGRVDAAVLLLKTILALFYTFAEESNNVWAFVLPALAAGLAWSYLYVRFLPYHNNRLNKIQVAFSFVYNSACVCALIGAGLGSAGSSTGMIAFLMMIPLSLFSGWSLAEMTAKQYSTGRNARGHELEMSTPYAVELRTRCLLADAMVNGVDARLAAAGISKDENDWAGLKKRDHSNSLAFNALASPTKGRASGAIVFNMPVPGDHGERGQHGEGHAHGAKAEQVEAARQLKDEVSSIYQEACRTFSNNPMISLFYASYHTGITKNLHLELLTNKEAQEKADWTQIDVHFFVWARLKQLGEQSEAAGASKMNVERRVRFERLSVQVREIVSLARDQILAFWSELAAKHPELPKLQTLGVSINENMLEAETMYQELLELAPQNASIMRGYADFLLEISNNPLKAQELLADAEQLEEEQSKSHALAASNEVLFANPVTDFDLSADTVGLFRIAADRDKLGTILGSNASACRLVGYSQREVQGKHLDDLIPSPISAVHQQIMSRFLESGETKWLGVARTTFLLHRSGHIVPVKLSVQPTGADFRCVVDTVPVPPGEMYLWCLGEASGWRVSAMCESSMSQLGVDHLSLKTGAVTLQAFASDPAGLIASADAAGEAKVQFSLPKSQHHVRSGRRDSMGKPMPTMSARSQEPDSVSLTVRVQIVQLPALGQPLYMLRLKRSGKQAGRFSSLQQASHALDVSNIGSDSEEEGSDAASDDVAGSSSSGSDSEHGDASTPRNARAVSNQGRPSRPTGHPHTAKGGDAAACPFITKGVTKAPVPVLPIKSAVKKAHVSLASDIVSPAHSPVEHSAFIEHVHAVEKGEGSALHLGKPVAVSNEDEDEDVFAALLNVPGTVSSPAAAPTTANPSPEVTGDDAVHGLTPTTATLKSASLALAEADKAMSPRSKGKKTLRMKLPSEHEEAVEEGSTPVMVDAAQEQVVHKDGEHVPAKHGHKAHSPVPAKREPLPKDAAMVAKPKSALKQTKVIDDDKSSASGSKHEGSVHSKGSGHSGTSATSITEIVRKGVTARAGVLESSLRNVKFAVLLTFFITAVLNVVSLLVTMQLMGQMQVNLELVYLNGVRSVLAQRMYANVQSWRMSAQGLADPVDMTFQKARNLVYLAKFDQLNEKLYSAVDGSLPAEKALYTDGSAITVKDYKWASAGMAIDLYNHTTRTLNLANGAIEFGSRMKRILDRNASEQLFRHPSGDNYWIAENGPNSIRAGMNQSLMFADERSALQGGKILEIDTIVLIVAEACFFIAIVGAMLPAVTNVAKSRKQVFDTFIQVPLPIVRALRATVHKRITALHQAEAEAEVGIDIGGKGDEFGEDQEGVDDNAEENLKGLLKQQRDAMRALSKGKPVTARGLEDDDDNDSTGLTTAVNASANQANTGMVGLTGALARRKKVKRRYRKAGSDVLRLFITFIWPVCLYMIYFLVMWDYKKGVVQSANHDKSETLWSVQIEVYMRMAAIRLRYAMSYCDQAFGMEQLQRARANVDFTEYLTDGLLYSSPERNMRANAQMGSDELKNLWMKDACAENGGWFYQLEDCYAFESGILGEGLLGASRAYGDLLRKLIAQRAEELSDPATCRVEHLDAPGDRKKLDMFASMFLPEIYERNTKMQLDMARDAFNAFKNLYTTVVACTVVALLAFWVIIYQPMIRKLDKDIKHVRLLLLLFPDEVARSVPAIVAAGRQLLQDASSSGGSVVSHRTM